MKEYRKIPSLKFMYEVNKEGIVRNVKSKKILKQRTTVNSNYLYIHTSINSKPIDIGVHRLVAECWCHIPEGYDIKDLVVNHKDFNIQNNNADNLEWITQQENVLYSKKFGHYDNINKGHPGYWKNKHLSDETKQKLSDYHKDKHSFKAININTKEEFIFKNLDDAEKYIRDTQNKESACIRNQILLACRGKRKVVYKHHWYFI